MKKLMLPLIALAALAAAPSANAESCTAADFSTAGSWKTPLTPEAALAQSAGNPQICASRALARKINPLGKNPSDTKLKPVAKTVNLLKDIPDLVEEYTTPDEYKVIDRMMFIIMAGDYSKTGNLA